MYTLHAHEINVITALQSMRSPFLDRIFLALNIFDNDFTYIFIIILVWNLIGQKAGFQLLYLQVINAILCVALKTFFMQPRPYDVLPALKIVEGTGIYGFPSGAASAIVVSFGFIFFLLKPAKPIVKISAVGAMLLVGLTRMYVGAHFPSDILGGYALGILILTIYASSINFFTKTVRYWPISYQLLMHGACMFCLLMLHFSQDALFVVALLSGALMWHLFFSTRTGVQNHSSRIFNYTAVLVTIIGVILLDGIFNIIAKNIPSTILALLLRTFIAFLMGMWLGASAYIMHYFEKKKN